MTTLRTEMDLEESNMELHDLCQPLTALQCRLEMAGILGHPESFQEAVLGGLEETRRLFHIVARMRQRLQEIEATA